MDVIPHVHDVVYPYFIEAATGNPPPSFNNSRKHNTGKSNNTSEGGNPDTKSDTVKCTLAVNPLVSPPRELCPGEVCQHPFILMRLLLYLSC